MVGRVLKELRATSAIRNPAPRTCQTATGPKSVSSYLGVAACSTGLDGKVLTEKFPNGDIFGYRANLKSFVPEREYIELLAHGGYIMFPNGN